MNYPTGTAVKTWTAWVTKTERYQVTVQGEDWMEARDAAYLQVNSTDESTVSFHVDNITQMGEPWCYSAGWYDLHGPGNVIVVERSAGNVFSESDIDLLRERLTVMGLSVLESWNGAGSGTVSFQCAGRQQNEQLSAEQLTSLTARRPRAKSPTRRIPDRRETEDR